MDPRTGDVPAPVAVITTLGTPHGQDTTGAHDPTDRPDTLTVTDSPAGRIEPAGPLGDLAVDDAVAVREGVDAAVRTAPPISRRAATREPVFPLWARDWDTFKEMVLWGARYGQHVTAFHAVRLPVYAGRLAVRSPLGLTRATRATYRWVTFKESAPLRHAIASDAHRTQTTSVSDAATYIRLEDQRQDVVRHRTWVLCGGGAGATLTTGVAAASMSAGQVGLTGAAVTLALGWLGQPADTPLLDRATSCDTAPRLTSDLIMIALSALGIAELNKGIKLGGDRGVHFIAPVTRDGRGWRADIDLPPGVPVGAIIDRRSELAAGLRRPLSCVWPEADPDAHEGRLTLWVADQPMSALAPKPWPLLDKGAVNLFETFPLGTDPKGKQVDLCLMFANMIIGAMPRFGKTFTLRLMLLAAALDPRVQLYVFDLKGGADFLPLEPVAHAFRIGDDDADGDIEYLLNALRKLVEDMRRRYKIIRSLPRDICPEGKVTDELASTKKLGLHPVVLALDECQRAFEHPEHGKEIASLVEDLVKRGPAVGIIAIPATQRPDVKSL
ncbi:MAG: FtsK/SpoIIIE domain-containing protein, partial [Angustibacter sp.]